MLLNLLDFSYFGLIYVIKKDLGHSDAWLIFYRCSKSLCQDFYIVKSGNNWHFRISSTLTSNFQMLIKFLSLTSGVWFFLCKPVFIWNLSMCQIFLKISPTKRMDGGGLLGPPRVKLAKNSQWGLGLTFFGWQLQDPIMSIHASVCL